MICLTVIGIVDVHKFLRNRELYFYLLTAEAELRQTYFDVLTDLAFPVIASRGAQLAFHLLQSDIETALAERTGIVPSYDCMKTWTQVYETIHAEEPGRHRADLALDGIQESERELIEGSLGILCRGTMKKTPQIHTDDAFGAEPQVLRPCSASPLKR